MITASAPGKIILFGEHAVVYGQPALAVPINSVQATATVRQGQNGIGLLINAVNFNISFSLSEQADQALAVMARLVLDHLRQPEPDAVIDIESTIPSASGLGSGAAVAAALGRALASYLQHPIDNSELSQLVFEVEKQHHGTPSGIDNTVVCYNQPVYFIKDKTIQPFQPQVPIHLVVGNTGIASPTGITVGAVRAAWQNDPPTYETYFQQIGSIVEQAQTAIEEGEIELIGRLMDKNQAYLEKLGVSSPELERLIAAARNAGALGAKLSGGGGGGNMIALADPDIADQVQEALLSAGAVGVISTIIN